MQEGYVNSLLYLFDDVGIIQKRSKSSTWARSDKCMLNPDHKCKAREYSLPFTVTSDLLSFLFPTTTKNHQNQNWTKWMHKLQHSWHSSIDSDCLFLLQVFSFVPAIRMDFLLIFIFLIFLSNSIDTEENSVL